MVREQFTNSCSEDVSVFLKERSPKDLEELAKLAAGAVPKCPREEVVYESAGDKAGCEDQVYLELIKTQ